MQQLLEEAVVQFLAQAVIYDSDAQALYAIDSFGEQKLIADVRAWKDAIEITRNEDNKPDPELAMKFIDALGVYMADAITHRMKLQKKKK